MIDPVLGPRSRPVFDDILKGKTQIPIDSIFKVDVETKNIKVNVKENLYDVGNELVYIVESVKN